MNAILEEKNKQQLLGEELSNEQVKKLFKQIDSTPPNAPSEVRPYVPDFEVRAAAGCEVEVVRIQRLSYVIARQYTHMSRGKTEQQQMGLAAQFLKTGTGAGDILPGTPIPTHGGGANAAAASTSTASMATLEMLNNKAGAALDRGRRLSRPTPALIQIEARELTANPNAPSGFTLGPKSLSATGRVSISMAPGARLLAPDQSELRADSTLSNSKALYVLLYTLSTRIIRVHVPVFNLYVP